MLFHLLPECLFSELLLSLVPILVDVAGHLAIVLVRASDGRLLYLGLRRLWIDGLLHVLFHKVFLILRFELVEVFMVWDSGGLFLVSSRFYRP